eukprot:snap_masked-scaffold_30-processed-gene-1.36-mRNA-1 protein AED:1.00 eAED:1.00 QI:0/-1/0/0/-1/1/1/0/78
MKTYNKILNDSPITLIKLLLISENNLFNDIVISFFDDLDKFVDGKVQFFSSALPVKHTLKRALSQELLDYIDSSKECI